MAGGIGDGRAAERNEAVSAFTRVFDALWRGSGAATVKSRRVDIPADSSTWIGYLDDLRSAPLRHSNLRRARFAFDRGGVHG